MTEIYRRRSTRHGLHLVLTLMTCGGWLLVWPVVWAWNAFGPRERTVITNPPHYLCGYHNDPLCRHVDPPQRKGAWPQ